MSAGGGGLADVQADQRLLELDVVQLHAGVLVEGGVVGGEAVGGLEGAAGLLRVALLQGAVGGGHEFLGFLGALALLAGLVLEIGLQVNGRRRAARPPPAATGASRSSP